MNLFARLTRSVLVASAFSPLAAFAHPGHDGDHGLTWDFMGEVVHHLTTPYHVLPAVAFGAVAVLAWRHLRAKRNDAKRK
jgi:hydrogenase/urease accessory protein HupE